MLQSVTYTQASEVLTRPGQRALAYADLGIDLRARVLAQMATMEADSGRVAHGETLTREGWPSPRRAGTRLAEILAARAREMTLVHPDDTTERMRLGDLHRLHASRTMVRRRRDGRDRLPATPVVPA
jgi:hypothetical protein